MNGSTAQVPPSGQLPIMLISTCLSMSTLTDVTRRTRDRADLPLLPDAARRAGALARRFDAAFRPLGITNGQFSLMTMLSDPRRAA